jgi:hypothetical protein
MKNLRLKYYFVSFTLWLPVEYEPQVTPEKPWSFPQVGLGLLLFQPFPLNSRIPNGILWVCLAFRKLLLSLGLSCETGTCSRAVCETRYAPHAGSFHFQAAVARLYGFP